jgi:DNA polymerase
MTVLNNEITGCSRCEDLVYSRTKPVPGSGKLDAEIFIVGEAPGGDEDKTGKPFVGRSGKLLTNILSAFNINREDVYIGNTCKCKPPQNRTPTVEEIVNCSPFLDRELALVKPKYVLCLGAIASQRILKTDTPIGKLRGSVYHLENYMVVCTYHPAYLLRNPDAKKLAHDDMVLFTDEIKKDKKNEQK